MSKKVTVSTGGHLIDANCKFNGGSLVESGGVVYDCTLNQTDIKSNKNKFYIMQLIKNGAKYVVYIRYGRIGEQGTTMYKDFNAESQAINFFERQFKTKTGNNWANKDDFEKKPGKYFLTELELADVEEEESESESKSESETDPLDERVIDLLKLISNTTYMNNTLVQLEIDTDKLPLGKISQSQIDKAYEILNEINENLTDKKLLADLSSNFYMLIPYSCGRSSPPIIDNKKLLGKYVELLNELSNLVYGSAAITKLKKDKGNMLKLYQDLHTDITPLEKTNKMYKLLESYIKNSKAPTHHFNYKIMDIFEINREDERTSYDKFTKKIDNKMLLFHGTRVVNTTGILKNGLMCDPSKIGIKVSISGKMFGLGLYCASSISKSIQYTAYDSSDNISVIFVCEVALGQMLKMKQADCNLTAKNLQKPYQSTYGIGKSSYKNFKEYKGVLIPDGKLEVIKENKDSCLLYDEFIVYHDEQINLRYIIKLKVDDDDDSD